MKPMFPLGMVLFLFCGCAMFEAKQQPAAPPVPPKTIAVPVGKDWQIVEEAPHLTTQPNAPPSFQTPKSVEPEGVQHPTAPPAPSKEHPKIEEVPR